MDMSTKRESSFWSIQRFSKSSTKSPAQSKLSQGDYTSAAKAEPLPATKVLNCCRCCRSFFSLWASLMCLPSAVPWLEDMG